MLHIIPTIDYEIFGNGRGDPLKHILRPAERLLSIANRNDVPLTIMCEIFEYIAYEKYNKQCINDYGYSPAEKIKNQLQDAYCQGHDIQLHIHPQFIDMKYHKKKFILADTQKSIADYSEEDVTKIMFNAKNKLISLIGDETYQCNTVRFSNMPWIEAPKNTLTSLEKCGFRIHSLYSYGLKNSKGYWKINDSSIYEIPIFSIESNFFKLLTLRRIFSLFYLWIHSPLKFSKKDKNISKNKYDYKSKIFIKWDISKLSSKEMIEFLRYAIKNYDFKNKDIPLVMIGHTKDFFNDKNFENFINFVNKIKKKRGKSIVFSTFSNFQINNSI